MRLACKEALYEAIKASNNLLVILLFLNFNILSHYLTTHKKKKQSYLLKYTYCGIRISLGHIWMISGHKINKTILMEMSNFISGIKWTFKNKNISKWGSFHEGKRPMSFAVYKKICDIIYVVDDDEYYKVWNILCLVYDYE